MASGGKRAGAGRPVGRWTKTQHRARPDLDMRHPVHVTMRVMKYVPLLRDRKVYAAIRQVMARYSAIDDFRICHLSIQDTHVHMLVEANDRGVLMRRMRSFTINAARAINRATNRSGQVFAQRYHTRQITTAQQARANVRYILSNWRKHGVDLAHAVRVSADPVSYLGFPVDPYSSGPSFAHWSIAIPRMPDWYQALPTSPPHTRLLAAVCHVDPYAAPIRLS
jgi:REP element-mobilizing transposase RayT